MAVNFSTNLYSPEQDQFGRPIMVTPIASQPSGGSYQNRGIYDSGPINILLDDGSIFSDQRTIVDICAAEYPVPPQQQDQISIPYDPASGLPDLGSFEITNVIDNGGGELTLELKKIVGTGKTEFRDGQVLLKD
jgi:hypothetical protein